VPACRFPASCLSVDKELIDETEWADLVRINQESFGAVATTAGSVIMT